MAKCSTMATCPGSAGIWTGPASGCTRARINHPVDSIIRYKTAMESGVTPHNLGIPCHRLSIGSICQTDAVSLGGLPCSRYTCRYFPIPAHYVYRKKNLLSPYPSVSLYAHERIVARVANFLCFDIYASAHQGCRKHVDVWQHTYRQHHRL